MVLIDGHNRKKICDKYSLPYKTTNLSFDSREDVKRWIIERQFGRRNLTPFQRSELALLLKPMLAAEAKKRMIAGKANPQPMLAEGINTVDTRDLIAGKAGISHGSLDKADFISQHADEITKHS